MVSFICYLIGSFMFRSFCTQHNTHYVAFDRCFGSGFFYRIKRILSKRRRCSAPVVMI